MRNKKNRRTKVEEYCVRIMENAIIEIGNDDDDGLVDETVNLQLKM